MKRTEPTREALEHVATPESRRFAAALLALREDYDRPLDRRLRDAGWIVAVPAVVTGVLRLVDVLHPWAPIVTAAVQR